MVIRGYYRCTHRNSQRCLATKQVQRFEDITYRGEHSCVERHGQKVQASAPKDPNSNITILGQFSSPVPRDKSQQLLTSLPESLTVQTQLGLDVEGCETNYSCNSFFPKSTPLSCLQTQRIMFSPGVHPSNYSNAHSLKFMPSEESNYFPLQPHECQMSNYVVGTDVHDTAPEIISADPVTNYPTMNMDFVLN